MAFFENQIAPVRNLFMGIVEKLRKKIQYIEVNWKTDINFSKRYAKLRRLDIICSTLRMKGLSNRAFKLREEYIIAYLSKSIKNVVQKYKYLEEKGKRIPNPPIFVCWWTGLDSAPPIVKQCVKSIYRNSGKHEVYLITKDNYREFISVPDYIINKMESGNIGLAHFSDYLRVSLIEKYGGLWLDATIFCSQIIPDRFFEYPFFTLKSPYTASRFISKYQWVTFCLGGWKGNLFYSFLRDAFENYWAENDYAIDYLFFDYLIYLARENCSFIKQEMESIPNNTPHRDDLQAAMNVALSAEMFSTVIKNDTELYKLSWRETYSKTTIDGIQSIYDYFLGLKFEDK